MKKYWQVGLAVIWAVIAAQSTAGESPPRQITNLTVQAVSTVALKLEWSNPISTNALVEYDLRVSTTVINALNWNSRQRLTNGVPRPGLSASRKSYLVFPLQPATRYYFGIKVKGANGLWSMISNVPLSVTFPEGTRGVTLEWDPSPDAWVAGYAVHYGTAPDNHPIRVDVGIYTNKRVTNLIAGVTYYFVATAYAADGQESLPSNEVAYTVPGQGGSPPRISNIPCQTTAPGTPIGPLIFKVSDAETTGSRLLVTAVSLNKTLVPDENIVLGGDGSTVRTIKLTPVQKITGTAMITVTAMDEAANKTGLTFMVTVEEPRPAESLSAD